MKHNLFPRILAGKPVAQATVKKPPLPWLLTNYKKETLNGTKTNQLSKTI